MLTSNSFQTARPRSVESVTVEVARSVEAVARLEPEWNALLTRAAAATPFQSPAWLLPWYRIWSADRVYALVVRSRGGELVGLVPGVSVDGRLELAGSGVGDYLAPLVDPNVSETVGAAFDAALARMRCRFHDVPTDVVWPWADGRRSMWHVAAASICPVVPLPPGTAAWRDSLAARPPAQSASIRNAHSG